MVRVEGGTRRHISSRRGRGNVGIPKGFPQSVERVGSRLHGFPCFPYSVISMTCFSRGKCWINRYAATQCNVPHSPWDAHRYSLLVIEGIGDFCTHRDTDAKSTFAWPITLLETRKAPRRPHARACSISHQDTNAG